MKNFCFLNNYPERSLSDAKSLKIFEKYDFQLVNDEKEVDVFTNRLLKINKDININNMTDLKDKDPLEIFFKSFYKKTNNDLDYVYCDELKMISKIFAINIEQIAPGIRMSLFAENNDLGLFTKNRKKLVKMGKYKERKNNIMILEKIWIYFLKVIMGSYKDIKEKCFFIDEDMLIFHFSIMVNPDEYQNSPNYESYYIDDKTRSYLINKMIYHSYWHYM